MNAADRDIEEIRSLLILLCREEFTEEEKTRATALSATINDWNTFTDLSLRHGVAAFIWQNMIDLHLETYVTEKERRTLEGSLLRTIARVTYINSVAAEIAGELDRNNIKVLFLKGMALETLVYGARGLRQMNDIDILVSPSDALKAKEILSTLGFTDTPLKSPLFRKILLEMGNHLPEMRRSGISVDIHFRLFGYMAAGITAGAIKYPQEIIISGKTYYILPPQIALMSMVKHIMKHEDKGEFQLRLYCDTFLLLRKFSGNILDENLLKYARQAGIESEVERHLAVMKEVFKVAVPAMLLPGHEKTLVIRDLFFRNMDNPGKVMKPGWGAVYRATLKSIKGIRPRLIFILGDAFPSVTFMKNRYGCSNLAICLVYYVLRLGKLFVGLSFLFRR